MNFLNLGITVREEMFMYVGALFNMGAMLLTLALTIFFATAPENRTVKDKMWLFCGICCAISTFFVCAAIYSNLIESELFEQIGLYINRYAR